MSYSYLLPILLIALWYFLGRFIQPIGEFYAAIFVPIGKLCLIVMEWLQAYKKAHETVYSKQPGLIIIIRLVSLVFALAAVVGEAYSSLIAVPALFGKEAGTLNLPFPGLAGPAIAILFFSLCSLFGILWLESSGYVPAEARLLEVPREKEKGFHRFITVMLITSIIATILYYIERKFFLLNPDGDITTYLQIGVFFLLGILVPFAGIVSIWIVAVGLQAILSIVFLIITFIASIVVEVLDFLSLHFSHGRMSVHDKTVGVLVHPRGVFIDEAKDEVLPHPVAIGENLMSRKAVGCFYGGSFGVQMQPIMEKKILALGAAGEIAACGLVSIHNSPEHLTPFGEDVSPTSEERRNILSDSQGTEEANINLLNRMGDKLIDAHLPMRSVPSSLLFFLDKDVLASSSAMLKNVNRQLPFHKIGVITMLDENDLQRATMLTGLQMLASLREEGVIATTFIFSSRSPFAAAVRLNGGAVKQLEFVAQTLTSLLIAHKHSKHNRSCVEVLQALENLSPFISFAFASDRIALIKMRWLRALLQLRFGKRAMMCDKDNVSDQTINVTKNVLQGGEFRAIDRIINLETPAILLYNIPLALKDRGFVYVQKVLVKFLGREYPSTDSLVVRGNGIPVHPGNDPLDPFYVQVSCLYPLTPASFEPETKELSQPKAQAGLPKPKEPDLDLKDGISLNGSTPLNSAKVSGAPGNVNANNQPNQGQDATI